MAAENISGKFQNDQFADDEDNTSNPALSSTGKSVEFRENISEKALSDQVRIITQEKVKLENENVMLKSENEVLERQLAEALKPAGLNFNDPVQLSFTRFGLILSYFHRRSHTLDEVYDLFAEVRDIFPKLKPKKFVALEFELCIEMMFLELPLVQPSTKSFTFKGTHTNTYRQPRSKDSWRINKGAKQFMSLWTLVFVLTHRPSDYIAAIDGDQKEYNLCKFKGCFTPDHMVVISTEEGDERDKCFKNNSCTHVAKPCLLADMGLEVWGVPREKKSRKRAEVSEAIEEEDEDEASSEEEEEEAETQEKEAGKGKVSAGAKFFKGKLVELRDTILEVVPLQQGKPAKKRKITKNNKEQ